MRGVGARGHGKESAPGRKGVASACESADDLGRPVMFLGTAVILPANHDRI